MPIIYRKAKINDYYGISYVSSYSWHETYRGYMPDQYLDDRINNLEARSLKTKSYLEKLEEDDDLDKYLVCEVDGKIVGICQYSKSQNERFLDAGLLGALYVLKDYQGLGIGKQLFKMAIEGVCSLGYKNMYLECLTGNRTISFYEKYGGKIIDNIDYHISDFLVKTDIVYYNDLDDTLKLINAKS